MTTPGWLQKLRRKQRDPEGRMPVMDHLRELRTRIVKMLLIIMVGTVIGFLFYNQILEILKEPYCSLPPEHRYHGSDPTTCPLIFTGPIDGFMIRLKVSFIAG